MDVPDHAVLVSLVPKRMFDEEQFSGKRSDHYAVWARLRVFGTP